MLELHQLARNDVISAAVALEAGINADALARLVRAGELHPLVRGWYTVRAPKDDEDEHWLRACAAYRRLNGTSMISHQTALIGHTLPLYKAGLSEVHLTKRTGGTTRQVPSVKVHRAVKGLIGTGDRVPPAVATVQGGLAGVPLTALVAADAALRMKTITPDELDAAVGLLAGYSGIGPVRAILRDADARHESPGETILAHRLKSLGYRLAPQFRIETDRGVFFTDLRILGERVVVEFDGKVKYTDRDINFAEKQREDAIRRKGWWLARFVWAELDNLALLRTRVDQAITSSRALEVRTSRG
jgi:very-short-patch-repair endonuclease